MVHAIEELHAITVPGPAWHEDLTHYAGLQSVCAEKDV